MTKPIHLKPGEVRRLERNLAGKQGRRREDPDATIRRLRAEIAELKQLLEKQQEIIAEMNQQKGTT